MHRFSFGSPDGSDGSPAGEARRSITDAMEMYAAKSKLGLLAMSLVMGDQANQIVESLSQAASKFLDPLAGEQQKKKVLENM